MCVFLFQATGSHLTTRAIYFCLSILSKKKKFSVNSISFFAVASSEKPGIVPTSKISEDSKILLPQTGNYFLFFFFLIDWSNSIE